MNNTSSSGTFLSGAGVSGPSGASGGEQSSLISNQRNDFSQSD